MELEFDDLIAYLEKLREQLDDAQDAYHAEGVRLAIVALYALFPDGGGTSFGENVLELTPDLPSPWDLDALWRAYQRKCEEEEEKRRRYDYDNSPGCSM